MRLKRRDGNPVSDRHARNRVFIPAFGKRLGRVAHFTRGFPFFSDNRNQIRTLAEAEFQNKIVKRLFPVFFRKAHPYLGRSAIGGLLDDFAHAEVVAHRVVFAGQTAHLPEIRGLGHRTVETAFRRDDIFLKRHRHGKRLKNGTGLINIRYRTVALVLHRSLLRIVKFVEIEGRPICQSQQTPASGFTGNNANRFRIIFFPELATLRFGDSLYARVNRQLYSVPVARRHFAGTSVNKLASAPVVRHLRPTVFAAEKIVHHLFNTHRRNAFVVDVTDELRRQLAFRITAHEFCNSVNRFDGRADNLLAFLSHMRRLQIHNRLMHLG